MLRAVCTSTVECSVGSGDTGGLNGDYPAMYVNLYLVECVIEKMAFAKLYAGVDNGTLHINIGNFHFLANRTRRGWNSQETTNGTNQPLHSNGD